MNIFESAYIPGKPGEITLLSFIEYIQNKLGLSEAGEHHIFCDLTGEPIFNSGQGIVYFVSTNSEPSYIEYEEGRIYIKNIEKTVAEKIANDFGAEIHIVYMHG